MNDLFTPRTVRLVSTYDDGEDAKHFTFEPVDFDRETRAMAGQFFMLTVPGHGEAPFTYTRAPDAQGRFDAMVRRVGGLTRALFDLAPGSLLGCRGPYGRGWPLDQVVGERRLLIVSGGCGLAPLAGAIEELLVTGAKLALIYGARTPASQVLAKERAAWQGRLPVFETFDEHAEGKAWLGTPLIALQAATIALGGEPELVFTCGPEVMMDQVAAAMTARGVSSDHIWLSLERRMHCGVGLCGHCYVASTYACLQGPTYRWDELQRLRMRAPSWVAQSRDVRHC